MVGAGSLGLWGKAEGLGLVQPGDEMAWGREPKPPSIYKKVIESMEPGSSEVHGGRARDKHTKLKEERFRLDIRKNIFTLKVVCQWDGFSQRGCAVSVLAGFQGPTG